MQRKILTTVNGKVMQVTFSPIEIAVIKAMAGKVSIPNVSKDLKIPQEYVGKVIKDLYNILEGPL